MDVIIVCHTEFGFVSDGEVIYDKEAKYGVTDGVNNLISLADKYGAKITFAVCPEVVDYMPPIRGHEMGLHIHPGREKFKKGKFEWVVGDSYLREHCKQSSTSTVLRDYTYQEQFEMIQAGKNLLTQKFGVTPKVFVAGRWSLNNDTIWALIVNGITHDCSAPAHSISDHFDWSRLPRICMPYQPAEGNYQEKGGLPILITPISRTLFGGTVNPEGVGIFGLSWLKACFLEHYIQGAPLFHICLHSPSMTDDNLLYAMDDLLSFIYKHKNATFTFASEIKETNTRGIYSNIIPYIFACNKNILKSGIRKLFSTKNDKPNR